MPAVRTRHPAARPHLLDLSSISNSPHASTSTPSSTSASSSTSKPETPPALTIIAPTPRTLSFPPNLQLQLPLQQRHNLAQIPLDSPSSSPFEAAAGVEQSLRGLALSAGGASSSPSHAGPFSPDYHGHAYPQAYPLPLSALTRTLTPVYTPLPASPLSPSPSASGSASASSPGPTTPTPTSSTGSRGKRRGASAAGSADDRPKKGDADYVKRPENAFILFRRQACADRAAGESSSSPSPSASTTSPSPSSPPTTSSSSATNPSTPAPITLPNLPAKPRQADLSKAISAQWRALPPEERAKWEALAAEKKREHEERYPGYVYRPRKKVKAGAAAAAGEGEGMDGIPPPMPLLPGYGNAHGLAPSVEFVLPARRTNANANGRSSSVPPAPAAMAYQTVAIPDVYSGYAHHHHMVTYPLPPLPPNALPDTQPGLFVPQQEQYPQPQQYPHDQQAQPYPHQQQHPTQQGTQGFSLLPLIMASASRRGPESQSTNLGGFDYLPAAADAQAEDGRMKDFEANLMASDFLRSMFAGTTFPSTSSSLSVPIPARRPSLDTTALDLSPASSPEPELATPGPAPSSAAPSFVCDASTAWIPPPSSALISPPPSASSAASSSSAPSPWQHPHPQYASLSLSNDGVSIAQPDVEFGLGLGLGFGGAGFGAGGGLGAGFGFDGPSSSSSVFGGDGFGAPMSMSMEDMDMGMGMDFDFDLGNVPVPSFGAWGEGADEGEGNGEGGSVDPMVLSMNVSSPDAEGGAAS